MSKQYIDTTEHIAEARPFPIGKGSVHVVTQRQRAILIRHMRPTDDHYLVELFQNLSEETRRFRFFVPLTRVANSYIVREAHRLADINLASQVALIAMTTDQQPEQAIGVARLAVDAEKATSAEFAIVLRDDYQREGLGTILLDLLVQVAMVRGIKQLHAVSLAENEGVHRLINHLGLPVRHDTRKGETTSIITLLE